MNSEEKISRLERDVARLRKAFAALVILASAGLLLAAVEGPGKLAVREFALVDEKGKTRTELKIEKDHPVFVMNDDSGRKRIVMASYALSQGIQIFDDSGVPRLGLGLNANGPAIGLYDTAGRVAAAFIPVPARAIETVEQPVLFDLGVFSAVLTEKSGKHYQLKAQILLAVEQNRKDASLLKRELLDRRAELRDAVNETLIGVDPAALTGAAVDRREGFRALRKNLKDSVNSVLSMPVDGVYIEEFLFQ